MKSKDTIKVGVMGCSSFAARSALPTFTQCNGFDVACIASRTEEKAAKFAEDFSCRPVTGYDALLEDDGIALIYMPLPTGLHDEWVIKCMNAEKHVIVEKSMASTLASAEKMVQVAAEKNVMLAENFMFQYHRQVTQLLQLVEDKTVGPVRQIRSSFGFPPLPEDNFRFNKKLGGGALLDAGAYTLKAAQLLLGRDLEVKSASLIDTLDRGVDTLGAAHLVDTNGISALLGFGFDNFYQCNIEVWGSDGKITLTRAFTAKPDFSPEIIIEKQGDRQVHQVEPDDQFGNFLMAVRDAITENSMKDFADEALTQAGLISSVFDVAYQS